MNRAVLALLCGLAVAAQAAEESKAPGKTVNPGAPAKSFFRWTDKEGKVHYGDHLPAEQAQTGGVKYDPTGLSKQTIEGAKSPELLAAEAKLKHLRTEQERLFSEQADRDQSLLRSFRGEEEVRMALQGNLNTLNTQLKLIQANLQRQQEKLTPLRQQADAAQKAGKPVPKNVADNLAATQKQVAGYQEQIAKNEEEKKLLAERCERDVARLNALKSQASLGGHSLSEAATGNAIDLLAGTLSCPTKEICGKGWAAARSYLQRFTIQPLSVDTDHILRTMEPASENEMALVVVRLSGQEGETLFLDTRCARSNAGQALCSGEKSLAVRRDFAGVVGAAMGSAAQ